MKKATGVCLVLLLLLFSACQKPATNQDVSQILQTVSLEVAGNRYSKGAEDGRLLVFNVEDIADVGDFVIWATAEYDHSPNCFALITKDSENKLASTKDAQNYLEQRGADPALFNEWTTFQLSFEKEPTANRATVLVDIQFIGGLGGFGVAYDLEKKNGTWEITGYKDRWIA